jgi:hypothetical protein
VCACAVFYGVSILVMKVSSRFLVGRDSLVGIATSYGPDGPGIKFWWKRDFPHSTRTALGPIQPFYTMGTVSLSRAKAAGAWLSPPTPSSLEVKE